MRFLLSQVFGSLYTEWYRRRRCGRVLLTSEISRPGISLPRGRVIPLGIKGLRGIALALVVLGVILFAVSGPPLGILCAALATGLVVVSIWPESAKFEMREFAVIVHSDLSHVDSRRGPQVIDYEWITDVRWDGTNRLVLALSEEGTLITLLRFARTEIPESQRREASRILWQRIGKPQRELAALSTL